MNYIAPSTAARKALVVHHPKSSITLRRIRQRWLQSRFAISSETADLIAELAFSTTGGRL